MSHGVGVVTLSISSPEGEEELDRLSREALANGLHLARTAGGTWPGDAPPWTRFSAGNFAVLWRGEGGSYHWFKA